MATTRTAATRDMHHQSRGLKHRSYPFVGLALLPPGALLIGVLIHFVAESSMVAIGLTAAGLSAVTTAIALLAYGLGHKRDPIVCWHVVATVTVFGLAEAVTVVVGWNPWWAYTYLIAGEIVAGSWLLHRIDALRKDPKGEEVKEDELAKKLGLENTKFGRPKHHTNDKGEVTRIEVPVKHGPGETVEVIQQAVPGIESLANAPRGRSRAVAGDGAGQSMLVIITQDVLKLLLPYPGPSSPGGCITEPLVHGDYEDQLPVLKYIAGGRPEAPNPASCGWMGMTRTGKTMNAQVCAMEMMSRRNVQIMWFDTVKGSQTVRPLRRGFDIIVASDDPRAFRAGMKAAKKLIEWRANRLGECGYPTWTAEAAADPRLKMPLLYLHFEEADILCDQAGDEMVFLASKGLSAGVVCGFSLQRADATSMPTGLRFNIGNWSVFGCGDDYSAGFALSSATIDAGAHPENWKQSKPGYSYHEGVGVPEDRWPVTAKSHYADGQQMEAHAEIWGPRMQPVDQGSVGALGDWYAKAKADTVALVAKWDAGPDAEPIVYDGTSSSVTSTNTAPTGTSDTSVSGDDGFGEIVATVREEIEEMIADGEIEPHLDEETGRIDATKPIPAPPPDGLSWADDKDAAPTREAALAAFERALREIADDPDLADSDDGEGVVFQVDTLVKRYKFRARPWFSEALTDVAEGNIAFPGLVLTRAEKVGHYRLRCLAAVAEAG